MRTKTNAISWNPMEPMNFTAANEDCNYYSYDARKLDEKCVHKDHVSAVMDIDYSPTGREFVTGSYDRTVRIFQYSGGHSWEIYHTKRMQRVFSVKFSCLLRSFLGVMTPICGYGKLKLLNNWEFFFVGSGKSKSTWMQLRIATNTSLR